MTASPRSPTRSTATPTLWRAVAELNRVDDPMRLRPGDRLLLPPLEELTTLAARTTRGSRPDGGSDAAR